MKSDRKSQERRGGYAARQDEDPDSVVGLLLAMSMPQGRLEFRGYPGRKVPTVELWVVVHETERGHHLRTFDQAKQLSDFAAVCCQAEDWLTRQMTARYASQANETEGDNEAGSTEPDLLPPARAV